MSSGSAKPPAERAVATRAKAFWADSRRPGKLLATVINNTIHHVKSIHIQQQSRVFLFSEKLEVPSFGVLTDEQNAFIESLKAVDSFTIGAVNLPLGRLVLAIQRWGHVREYVIGGSIEKYGNMLRLTAQLRNGQTGKVKKGWTVSETFQERGEEGSLQTASSSLFSFDHFSYQRANYFGCGTLEFLTQLVS